MVAYINNKCLGKEIMNTSDYVRFFEGQGK